MLLPGCMLCLVHSGAGVLLLSTWVGRAETGSKRRVVQSIGQDPHPFQNCVTGATHALLWRDCHARPLHQSCCVDAFVHVRMILSASDGVEAVYVTTVNAIDGPL